MNYYVALVPGKIGWEVVEDIDGLPIISEDITHVHEVAEELLRTRRDSRPFRVVGQHAALRTYHVDVEWLLNLAYE